MAVGIKAAEAAQPPSPQGGGGLGISVGYGNGVVSPSVLLDLV
jgi:hypothetical protein